jgi:prolyl-tRNA synthetase
MVIKPYGYAIWENMQKILDRFFKATGHLNAYFPLFIPESLLKKEKEHVEGFAPECAVVTHGGGKKLEEPLMVRPTSETIIYATYAKWVDSWRDLPILINQWANVVRWEMRTRLFLRTTEFLWQEGHTVHATAVEAEAEALKMLEVYQKFAEDYLAMPVIPGKKSDKERFAGALRTYTVEAMMQDSKALQAGTSHNLGQNFAKAFNIKFTDQDGQQKYAWQTSWGVSTRLIGALIMTHSDDQGLVLPPEIAPIKIVIIPIWKNKKEQEQVLKLAREIKDQLKSIDENLKIDDRDNYTPGFKFNEWEVKGVPIRLELGPKDLEKKQVILVRRDTGEKTAIKINELTTIIKALLVSIQTGLWQKAQDFQKEHTYHTDDYNEFKKIIKNNGFIYSHWCGSEKCENEISAETKATIRCLPLNQVKEPGQCLKCGAKTDQMVIFAKAY